MNRHLQHAATILVAAGLLLACGGNDDSGEPPGDDNTTPTTTDTAAPTTAPTAAEAESESDAPTADDTAAADTSPSSSADTSPSTDAPAGGLGRAVVDVDGVGYEFVVIQCLRDTVGPLSDTVIEFQLDGVPVATPPPIIEGLLGVIAEDADVLAELEPVVELGPILSIARVAGGGELVTITDLGSIEIVSDGDPLDTASRSLDISSDAAGATVTGTTTAGGSTITVDATCP